MTSQGLQMGCIGMDRDVLGPLTLLSRSSRWAFSSLYCAASARAAANAPESITCPKGCPQAFSFTADALALQTAATCPSHLDVWLHLLDSRPL